MIKLADLDQFGNVIRELFSEYIDDILLKQLLKVTADSIDDFAKAWPKSYSSQIAAEMSELELLPNEYWQLYQRHTIQAVSMRFQDNVISLFRNAFEDFATIEDLGKGMVEYIFTRSWESLFKELADPQIYFDMLSHFSVTLELKTGAAFLGRAVSITSFPFSPVNTFLNTFKRGWLSSLAFKHPTLYKLFQHGIISFVERGIWSYFFAGGFLGMCFGLFYGRIEGNPYLMSTYRSVYS
ncbi:MAG: hypothetical protein ACTSQQ_07965 [Candidatus Helarchaeota archaeon]